MFSGIVEEAGIVSRIEKEQGNIHFTIRCSFTNELKIDQSIAHNGVCLTVVRKDKDEYTVTAIKETLEKSNLGTLNVGDWVNLERSMKIESLLDGHLVQGHVDKTAVCTGIEEAEGSWYYTFEYNPAKGNITVEKGSIAVNGVSLTVVNSKDGCFQNAIIPYTYEHTNFCKLQKGSVVNLEFDIIGKYITRFAELYINKV
ncbi:MAG: riboflavin synthase [Prevotellaceae bacterium]|jgi:riboflavin synthase|nr:riboflavin synthase [Prevotellaceae bacterium]